jgi:hypothetical protein
MIKMLRPSRLFMAAALLLVMLLVAPNRLSSAAPQEIPDLGASSSPPGASGFVSLTIWQEGLGYDGENWVQLATQPIDYFMPLKDGVGFDWSDAYSYMSVDWHREDGLGWVECGWIVQWEMFAFLTPPPDCTLSIAFRENFLPGMCWGCVGPFCDANATPPDKMPGEVYATFKVGKEILKGFPANGPNFKGTTYVLIDHVTDYGMACEHNAFIP